MSYSISQLKRLACLLSAVMCASFSAEGAVKITECSSYQLCSTESKALNYALSKSNGDNTDIVLVNTVMNKTSIIEVRNSDFGGTTFSGMPTVTAEEVYIASTAGHMASVDLVHFLEDPIISSLNEDSVVLGTVNGRPIVPLEHFYALPHKVSVRGSSLFSINNELESPLNNAFQDHSNDLLDNIDLSGDLRVGLAFRKVLAVEIGASFDGASVDQMEVFFKASQPEGEAPWGVIVDVKKNGSTGLITKITRVALIENGSIVFVIPVKEDGTVDTEKLIGTTFRVSGEASHSSIRGWFAGINLDISIAPCSSVTCNITVIDLDKEEIESS